MWQNLKLAKPHVKF